MEENTYKIRKDKVKNIAIVFLTVMLVLTFFSNSILNRALPEVATEYVAYDTITERVRGTGTVTADDPYKVVVKDSRTIESVAVSAGDMVMKDQVLFYLEDEESDELKEKEEEIKAKEEELSKQVLDYMTAILSVDISSQAYLNIENDNIASMAAYQAQIEASRQKVQSAQDTVDSLNRQLFVTNMEPEGDIDKEKQLAAAQASRDSAKKRMEEAQTQINEAAAAISAIDTFAGGSDTNGDGVIDDTEAKLEVKKSEKTTAYDAAKGEYNAAKDDLRAQFSDPADPTKSTIDEYFEGDKPKDESALEAIRIKAGEKDSAASISPDDAGSVSSLFNTFKLKYDSLLLAEKEKVEVENNVTAYPQAKAQLDLANTALTNATNEYNTYQSQVDNLSNQVTTSAEDILKAKNNLNLSLEDAKSALADAQKEQEQLLKDISSELALSSKNDDIADIEEELAELKEELAELQAEATGATIVSPVEGTIISVSKAAGESTTPAEEVALIQVTGKGMTCSFSVTNDQAAKVKVGDVAELQNAWYYTDVMVTLSKIRPDPDDPGKRKLLEFNVEGSVQNGESLTLSVGERSAEYDFVVPNSAIREDKNGKFILIIEEKSTPFGNRYKAKRVDAEVMASDETKSAISADLQGYEYVITTSNQPVESGDQVRLAGY